mgnify:CR=1 FL=1
MFVLFFFFGFFGYSQNCDLYKQKNKNDKYIINELYKCNNKIYINTQFGEVMQAVVKMTKHKDFIEYKVLNFPYMINMKYHNINHFKDSKVKIRFYNDSVAFISILNNGARNSFKLYKINKAIEEKYLK